MVIATWEHKTHLYLTQREDPLCVWEDGTEEVGPKRSDATKNREELHGGGGYIIF